MRYIGIELLVLDMNLITMKSIAWLKAMVFQKIGIDRALYPLVSVTSASKNTGTSYFSRRLEQLVTVVTFL